MSKTSLGEQFSVWAEVEILSRLTPKKSVGPLFKWIFKIPLLALSNLQNDDPADYPQYPACNHIRQIVHAHCDACQSDQRRPYAQKDRQPGWTQSDGKHGDQDSPGGVPGWKRMGIGGPVHCPPFALRPAPADGEFDRQDKHSQADDGKKNRQRPGTPEMVTLPA